MIHLNNPKPHQRSSKESFEILLILTVSSGETDHSGSTEKKKKKHKNVSRLDQKHWSEAVASYNRTFHKMEILHTGCNCVKLFFIVRKLNQKR